MFHRIVRPAIFGAVAALLLGGASFAVAGEGSSGDGAGSSTFKVFDVTVASHNVDVDNSHSFSIGDEFIFTDQLWNVARTKHVGILHGNCTVVSMSGQGIARCSETATLFGRGTLEASGESPGGAGDFRQAIDGGTGSFDTALGQILIHPINANNALVTVDLDR